MTLKPIFPNCGNVSEDYVYHGGSNSKMKLKKPSVLVTKDINEIYGMMRPPAFLYRIQPFGK